MRRLALNAVFAVARVVHLLSGSPAWDVLDLAAHGSTVPARVGLWVPWQPCPGSPEPAGSEHQAGPGGAPWDLERQGGKRTLGHVWDYTRYSRYSQGSVTAVMQQVRGGGRVERILP